MRVEINGKKLDIDGWFYVGYASHDRTEPDEPAEYVIDNITLLEAFDDVGTSLAEFADGGEASLGLKRNKRRSRSTPFRCSPRPGIELKGPLKEALPAELHIHGINNQRSRLKLVNFLQ